jgi:hypothetical protein
MQGALQLSGAFIDDPETSEKIDHAPTSLSGLGASIIAGEGGQKLAAFLVGTASILKGEGEATTLVQKIVSLTTVEQLTLMAEESQDP